MSRDHRLLRVIVNYFTGCNISYRLWILEKIALLYHKQRN